ncbi:MAG: CDP-alcohol phosphatidyltransferase family protein [Chloroherpetonaceae bacterium]|nr:CDP-alcohol phosphatidyltransferase family protein [bacterium]
MGLNKSKIESTYKSSDTEEFLDRIFYRKVGYAMAIASQSIGLTPNGVTYLSIVVGVVAGHLFYYQNITINLIGVLLLITAEAMDGADGQLARLTNTHSRYGRILDGFAGNLWFLSIYLHMCARFVVEGGTPLIFVFAIISGASHSSQSAMADYYRSFYLYFFKQKNTSVDDLEEVKDSYSKLSWRETPYKKFLLMIYKNYIRQQHLFSKNVRILLKYIEDNYGGTVPSWFADEYRKLNKPMIKYQNILTTNTRMIVLFISIIWGNIFDYFLFEAIILNLVLVYFLVKEEKIHKDLLLLAKSQNEQINV